ncbi:MAG TPA: sigma-70 family RNA polymerase sigma factor [Acidimicrobiales bacterium]|nr:sigma-70 family RNA polymerase sigma factor [Acidimicrobiales bacterium]
MTVRRISPARPELDAPGDGLRLASLDDRALADGVGAGNHEAFAEIFERYSGRALALALHLMKDAQRAEEVVQEVFVRLWVRPERYDPCRGNLRNFLLADVHGRAVDALRSDGRRVDRERRDHERPALPARDADVAALDRVAATDIRSALGMLVAEEREAIALAYLGGHTYREVARMLGQPEGTVKSRIRSGLARLRVALDREQIVDDN